MKKLLKKTPAWLYYTIGFGLLAGMMFGYLLLADKSLVWFKDGMAQHYPILKSFRQMLVNFIAHPSQGFTHWSWDIGLGGDQLTNYSYYVMGDLFNYLIIFFPKGHLELAYGILVFLRLYCVGLAYILFASTHRFSKIAQVGGALTYTFTGYLLYSSLHHPFFILPMIFFPLLAYGVDRIATGHSFVPLAVAVFFTVLANFYFAWMLAIATILYAVLRFASRFSDSHFKVWPYIRRVVLGAVIGGLTGLVTFLPTALFALHSTRISGKFASGLLFYSLPYYLGIPDNILTPIGSMQYWMIMGMSSVSFLGIVYAFKHFKANLWLNIGLISIFVGILFPAVGAVFNGLAAPSNRWVFLGALGFSFAAMILIDHLNVLTRSDIATMIIASLLLIVSVWLAGGGILNLSHRQFVTYGMLLCTLILLLMAIVFNWRPQTKALVITLSLSFNLAANITGIYSTNVGTVTKKQLNRGLAQRFDDEFYNGANNYLAKKNGFFRTAALGHYSNPTAANSTNTNTNIGMDTGINDENSYLTLQNGYPADFSRAIANSQFTANTPIGELDYRTAANNLLGVQYFYARASTVWKQALPYGYHVVKNKDNTTKVFKAKAHTGVNEYLSNINNTALVKSDNALPLIYTQKQTISKTAFDKLNALDREQVMTQAAAVENKADEGTAVNYRSKNKTINYKVAMDTSKVVDSKTQLAAYRFGMLGTDPKKVDERLSTIHKQLSLNANKKATNQMIKDNQAIIAKSKKANKNGLKFIANDASGKRIPYTITLDNPNQAKNAELYLVLDGIRSDKESLIDKTQIDTNQHLLNNTEYSVMDRIADKRKNILHPSYQQYRLHANTNNNRNALYQYPINNLSNYQPVDKVTLNLGYSSKTRKTIKLKLNGDIKDLHIKSAKLVAVPYDKTYTNRMQALKQTGLKNLKVDQNVVTGTSHTQNTSTMVTSIPYSTGWQLTIDGKKADTFVVNKGFVGAKLPGGNHKIRLTYTTPGLKLGKLATIVGIVALIISMIVSFFIFRGSKKQK
ncbi:YfhO family protein [Lentilactobacillus kribbianus]|uniref:YfhO family protein n=1 Tax=Lentilactobacillus kribbianus TaxID=2729622 RepID=UPI001554F6DE|nr:YfhO family protein [Lentilactobacillus kribbianus]